MTFASRISSDVRNETDRMDWAEDRHVAQSAMSRYLLLGIIGIVSLMQLELATAKSLNWDEFWHYGLLHKHYHGGPRQIFQVPFAYLFGWVSTLPGSAIDHVIVARLLTWPFFAWTAFMIALGAQRFVNRQIALLAALAYMTGGYTFSHGIALRADPIAAAMLTSALVLGLHELRSKARWMLFLLLIGLAFVASIKSALYLPAFLALPFLGEGMQGLRMPHPRIIAIALAIFGIATFTAVLVTPDQLTAICKGLYAAAERMFGGGILPESRYAVRAFSLAPFLSAAIVIAAFVIARNSKTPTPHRIGIALLMTPLASVLVYLNAYPYFYQFILAPVVIGASIGIEALVRRFGLHLTAAAFLANAAAVWIAEDRKVIENQRRFQQIATGLIGEEAKYIDNAGVLAPYPRAVDQYWSGWALESYRNVGRPIIREAIARETVPMVIVNTPALLNAFAPSDDRKGLLPADRAILQTNYIHARGPFYLAGKFIAPGDRERIVDINIPGPYRIENAAISIDGYLYSPGEVVDLARGEHLVVPDRRKVSVLRWGNGSEVASGDINGMTVFTDY